MLSTITTMEALMRMKHNTFDDTDFRENVSSHARDGVRHQLDSCHTKSRMAFHEQFKKPLPKLNSVKSIDLVGRTVVRYVEEHLDIFFGVKVSPDMLVSLEHARRVKYPGM
eukprot:g5389.t1